MIEFDEAALARNWPELWEAFVTGTPLRAVLSSPLLPPLGPSLVLDVWLRDPAAMRELDRDAVEQVVVALTRHVVQAVISSGEDEHAAWWRGPDARARTRVWEAVGVLAVALERDHAEALAVLKAHAFAGGQVLEEVADDVLAGRLSPAELDGAPRVE